MAGINKVILVGNLGKDPEIRNLDSGVKVASFSLATTEFYKDKEGNRADHTEWHNIVLWRGLADVAESYLKKGSQIYLEGRIRTRQWEDKDGNKRYTTDILGDNLMMLGRREDTGSKTGRYSDAKESEIADSESSPVDDDLPF